MSPRKLSPEEFESIYGRVPRACVEVIVRTEKGIILSKREIRPCEGYWHIPGGTVFLGEKLEGAVQRVAQEELGLEVKVEKLLGIIQYPAMESYGQAVGIAFLTSPISGEFRGCEQAKEVAFFKEIPQDTIPEQKIFLENYLRSTE